MENTTFVEYCKRAVEEYVNSHLDIADNIKITERDIYIVWLCKALGNNKALLSTTLPDGMYYEVTYNGNKNEMYLDAYKKFENKCIDLNKEW